MTLQEKMHLTQAASWAHEIDTTEDNSLSDSPPVILSASFPRSPVRILTTSETGITACQKIAVVSKKYCRCMNERSYIC
jgi:hypothetical protein